MARITMTRFTAEYSFYRFKEPVAKPSAAPQTSAASRVAAPLNWPSFRGPDGTGVADGQHPPSPGTCKKGKNVRWKTPIPGLGHSCPVVWGDRVFLTTAISGDQPDPKIRVGNYGDVGSVDDTSKHTWQVLCLDRDTRQDPLDADGLRRRAEDQAAPQGQPGELHAGDRRQARRRLLRLGRAVLLRLRRQAALEARPQHARFQLRHRPGVRMGLRQLADHPRRAGASCSAT